MKLDHIQLRKYFRSIRLLMLIKRSLTMCNRKRLTNWIRICNRLNAINAHATRYSELRKKWIIFNRWLKYLENETTNCSNGIVDSIKRRFDLYNTFSVYLQEYGYKQVSYIQNKQFIKNIATFTNVFFRWKVIK